MVSRGIMPASNGNSVLLGQSQACQAGRRGVPVRVVASLMQNDAIYVSGIILVSGLLPGRLQNKRQSEPKCQSPVAMSGLTLAPPTNVSMTIDQFYCQGNRDLGIGCLSLSEFVTSSFDQLCPSGNCLEDCQNLDRLYQTIPSGLQVQSADYGSNHSVADMVTLYGLCMAYPNISRSLDSGLVPETETGFLKPLFPSTTIRNLQVVTNSVTQCLFDTCQKAVDSDRCGWECSPPQLLLNGTTPLLSGGYHCIKHLCNGSYGLPFGNQDVVGIGVTVSYVVQSVLVLLAWLGLAAATINSIRHHRHTTSPQITEAKRPFLESLDGFLQAQCYFSIPIAVATLITDPFHLDPLNAYGFLPVAVNGFLPQTFTLLQLHRYRTFSWYLSGLTFVSWLLSTIILWAIIDYLTGPNIGTRDFEFRSLSQIDTCGGSTALALCPQSTGDTPLGYIMQTVMSSTTFGSSILFGTTTIGTLIVPTIWVFCTLCLIILLGHQCLGSTGLELFPSRSRSTSKRAELRNKRGIWNRIRYLFANPWTGTVGFSMASLIFFLATGYQGLLYYNFISLNLVDRSGWGFGQIIAITVWVPVVFDYMHAQSNKSLEGVSRDSLKLFLTRSSDPAESKQHRGKYEQMPGDTQHDEIMEAGHRNYESDGGESVSSATEGRFGDTELRRLPSVHAGEGM